NAGGADDRRVGLRGREPDRNRPCAPTRTTCRRARALGGREAAAGGTAHVGPCAGGPGGRVTYEEARAQFPVLERFAYLNAGSLGPLSRATIEAIETRTRFDQEHG